MKYSKGMLYGVLGLILAHPVYATVDCSSGAKPSCDALGYTETTCSSGSYVACPYDKTKKKCIPVAPTCEDLGFTVNDKSVWCDSIVECPSNSEYTLCSSTSYGPEDCSDYTLETCPANAVCDDCGSGNAKRYKKLACNPFWYDSSTGCVSCTRAMDTCPANATCADMISTDEHNRKCFLYCKSGYTEKDGSCVKVLKLSVRISALSSTTLTCAATLPNSGNYSVAIVTGKGTFDCDATPKTYTGGEVVDISQLVVLQAGSVAGQWRMSMHFDASGQTKTANLDSNNCVSTPCIYYLGNYLDVDFTISR